MAARLQADAAYDPPGFIKISVTPVNQLASVKPADGNSPYFVFSTELFIPNGIVLRDNMTLLEQQFNKFLSNSLGHDNNYIALVPAPEHAEGGPAERREESFKLSVPSFLYLVCDSLAICRRERSYKNLIQQGRWWERETNLGIPTLVAHINVDVEGQLVPRVKSVGSPVRLAADHLRDAMPNIRIDKVGGTTTNALKPCRHLKIEKWVMSRDELHHISMALNGLGNITVLPSEGNPLHPAINHTSEAETNQRFFQYACGRINQVYNAKGIDQWWNFMPKSREGDNSLPDFTLTTLDKTEEWMVLEGKFATVLPCLTLSEAFNTYNPKKRDVGIGVAICNAVAQLCGYMDTRCLRYGGLVSYEHSYFFKYMGPNHYAVTDAMLCTDKNPSVPEVLFGLVHMSKEQGKVPRAAAINKGKVPSSAAPGDAMPSARNPPANGSAPPAKMPRIEGPSPTAQALGYGGGSSHSVIPKEELILEAKLGYGQCGTVSLGRLSGQEVAVKCVDACNSTELIPLLQHEVGILGHLRSLQGVYVPELYAYGFWNYDLSYVLVMSVIHGQNPGRSHKNPTCLHAANKALQAIHAAGVAHGDISASNILVDDKGKAWFIDFGHAIENPNQDVCQDELDQLRDIFSPASHDSDKSGRDIYGSVMVMSRVICAAR